MNTAWNEFKYSIAEVKKIRTIYDHMIANVRLSQEDVSDLLRAQLVNAVSALDRFFTRACKDWNSRIFFATKTLD